ncbi:MAG: alpha-N-arabinofuranosidase [Bacteroidetes bacterium]|nr:alpha-N-arabinofuranosidase [Bacteroidota bacterium]
MRSKIIFIVTVCLSPYLCRAQETAAITIGDSSGVTISKYIYGQFAEHLGRGIYDGFYRDGHIRTDIVNALREIKVPDLRWPGGCFADQYHWRDGIGPKEERPKTVNTTWGMVTEDNSFGTNEFMELCKEIGCEPYIAGNVGTGSPQEMKDWITYLNYDHHYHVSLWGVGNESWGCGGNMTPEYYANLYNHFAAFLPDYPGSHLKKVISGANGDDYHWTEVMMKQVGPDNAWGLSLHYYTFPTGKWKPRGSATHFSEQEYVHTLVEAENIDTIIAHHERIMDRYDPQKKLALMIDEWGVWTDVEPGTPGYAMYQQNSLRDALAAATTLNIFNNRADRVRGANLAQAVNVIQSLILTKGDKMIRTPTYWVFDLYKDHQDAKLLPVQVQSPLYNYGKDTVKAVNLSASIKDGLTHVTLVNLDAHQSIRVNAQIKAQGQLSGQILTSKHFTDINTFGHPETVKIVRFTDAKLNNNELTANLPPISVVELTIKP